MASDNIKFLKNHQPQLNPGLYKLDISQDIEANGKISGASYQSTLNFCVAGERFDLPPTMVSGVFPPPGSRGDFTTTLPHIILKRSTLPWERSAVKHGNGESPWLILLVFGQDDSEAAPIPQTLTVNNLLQKPLKPVYFPTLQKDDLQPGDNLTDKITVIDVPKKLLASMMPGLDDLPYMAHVRIVDREGAPEVIPVVPVVPEVESAVVLANRLPVAGQRNTVHLVSIEHRFTDTGFDYQGAADTDLIRLVSLKNWEFYCEETLDGGFEHLMMSLQLRTLKYSLQPAGQETPVPSPAENFLSQGFTALEHHFRNGQRSYSWFRGPLTPVKNNFSDLDFTQYLPETSDELLRFYEAEAMFDASYAAAWELGRLLALRDKSFSIPLLQYKRAYARNQALLQQKRENSALLLSDPTETAFPDLPQALTDWLKKLIFMENIPFNYLVPDSRMLPPETIGFFTVDPYWMKCLFAGAISVGRATRLDFAQEKTLVNYIWTQIGVPAQMTGFLLRSEVVKGWPGLKVDGYSTAKQTDPPLIIHELHCSDFVKLFLFEGVAESVNVHLKAETLHFGFDELDTKNRPVLTKSIKELDGTSKYSKPKQLINAWMNEKKLSLSFKTIASDPNFGCTGNEAYGIFAMQMVEGVPMIQISMKSMPAKA